MATAVKCTQCVVFRMAFIRIQSALIIKITLRFEMIFLSRHLLGLRSGFLLIYHMDQMLRRVWGWFFFYHYYFGGFCSLFYLFLLYKLPDFDLVKFFLDLDPFLHNCFFITARFFYRFEVDFWP